MAKQATMQAVHLLLVDDDAMLSYLKKNLDLHNLLKIDGKYFRGNSVQN